MPFGKRICSCSSHRNESHCFAFLNLFLREKICMAVTQEFLAGNSAKERPAFGTTQKLPLPLISLAIPMLLPSSPFVLLTQMSSSHSPSFLCPMLFFRFL